MEIEWIVIFKKADKVGNNSSYLHNFMQKFESHNTVVSNFYKTFSQENNGLIITGIVRVTAKCSTDCRLVASSPTHSPSWL